MGLWVAVDDSIGLAELGAGAVVAALAALLTELALHQADLRPRLQLRWLPGAYRLPGQVLGDTVLVFRALARQLAHGEDPPSGFRELPVRLGDAGDERSPGGSCWSGRTRSLRTPSSSMSTRIARSWSCTSW